MAVDSNIGVARGKLCLQTCEVDTHQLPADIDMAKDLMLEVCEHRAQNGIVESATLAALSERTPSWFMAAREYNKLGYASQDWNDEAEAASAIMQLSGQTVQVG